MSANIAPHAINGVSLLTRSGKFKSRYSSSERLQILGATQADLNATIRLFCPGRPLYAATRGKNDDPHDWTTPRGRLPESEVLRHLTGNLTPEINPRWVAPHSWEVTRWVGIDVDFRGDRDDFKRRCKFVIEALRKLGVPSEAILKSLTPSGGRHYRFFTTRNVRVTDIPPVMAMVGLHESSGQIEIFPKLNKGMRLPFGFIPGREHDPGKWLRFIRAYQRSVRTGPHRQCTGLRIENPFSTGAASELSPCHDREQWQRRNHRRIHLSKRGSLKPCERQCHEVSCRPKLARHLFLRSQEMDQSTGTPNESLLSTKVLNVVIPEAAYWHLRRCATASRMSMKEFMATFCMTATPIILEASPTSSNVTHHWDAENKAA